MSAQGLQKFALDLLTAACIVGSAFTLFYRAIPAVTCCVLFSYPFVVFPAKLPAYDYQRPLWHLRAEIIFLIWDLICVLLPLVAVLKAITEL